MFVIFAPFTHKMSFFAQAFDMGAFGDSYAPYGYKHRRYRHGKVGGDGRALGIVEHLVCS